MIREWQSELEKYGFTYTKWSSSEKAYVRYIGNIQQQIWEQTILDVTKKVAINVCVLVFDPFREDNTFSYLPVLSRRLGTDGVVISRSDTGVGRLWEKEEGCEAVDALKKYALPWCDQYSSLDTLIEYLLNGGSNVSSKEDEYRTLKDQIMFWKKQYKPTVTLSPNDQLALSLLFYHKGNFKKSCEYAKMWLKYCRISPDEPDRTMRQLTEMGCTQM